jgi:hypothetical protein
VVDPARLFADAPISATNLRRYSSAAWLRRLSDSRDVPMIERALAVSSRRLHPGF